MTPKAPERLYRIQGEPDHFYTGRLPDGTQVLMGVDADLCIVNFDRQGNYLTIITQPQDLNSTWEEDWKRLNRWAANLGVVGAVITVKSFSLPEQELDIRELPDHLQEILDNGEELSEDAKEKLHYWRERRDYVLIWGNDYHVDEQGFVVST